MVNEKRFKSYVLVVDDDRRFCESIQRSLKDDSNVLIATSKDEAYKFLWQADVVLLDIRLDEKDMENRDGMIILKEFLEERPQLPVIMMTAHYRDVETAVEAMKTGAMDFLQKPLDLTKLKTSIINALKQAQLSRKVKNLKRELESIEPIELIGDSKIFKEIRNLIDYIAKDGYITVLIQGETGTGKELVAKMIHQRGWRAEGPFVAVSLSSLPSSIIERELFGNEKGAFTDAREKKIGYIEEAHGGVFFLDDIDATPLEVQSKLLRFFEERCIYRLGSTKPVFVNVQVVTSTNQNLFQLVQEKKFREDLFYRINTMEIRMPPLREHPEDIPSLCSHFLQMFEKQGRTVAKEIKKEAMEKLMKYRWPGNVRELRNILERACIMADIKGHDSIDIDDLPKEMVEVDKNFILKNQMNLPSFNIEKEKARIELFYIEKALEKAGGKKSTAYRILGLNDRFALRRKIKSIKRKHPELFKEFPLVSSLFES